MTTLLGAPLSGKTTRLVQAFQQQLAAGYRPDHILCLSFFASNANAIRQTLRPLAGQSLPWVITLQTFQTRLLRRYARAAALPRGVSEISATARGLLLRQAWRAVGGPVWQAHGDAPGATSELVRLVDWISLNRQRFRVATGELANDELARVYARYIAICDQHRLLTFQEASLRCLELLEEGVVAASVRQSFPVVLVDDLHLARPDQLALVERLRGLATHFTATAWLADAHPPAAPELEHIDHTLKAWSESERLPSLPLSTANPAVIEAGRRVLGAPSMEPVAYTQPNHLHLAFTVEDEAQAVAQVIVRALLDDETLQPAAVAVIAAERRLLPFMQRVLGDYGLPVESQPFAARHTPLVRGGLLVLGWTLGRAALGGATAALGRDLLSLPYLALEAVDAHVLAAEAEALDKPLLMLPPEDLARLKLAPDTLARLDTLRAALAALDASAPLDELVRQGLAALGAFEWLSGGAAEAAGFTADEQNRWQAALRSWQRGLRELEALLRIGPVSPAERLSLADAAADAITLRGSASGVRLLEPGQVNGVHARLAFVVGLSESAAPARRAELQLLAETDLPGLFADGRAVVLPRARDHAAWIEREARALAELLTRGTEQLWVSTSRYTAAGEAQLPSPFFERLLGAEGEIDRDGNLVVTRPGLWQAAAAASEPVRLLPRLGLGAAGPRARDLGTRLLAAPDHGFSASQVRLYLTCPLQFFYARVLGIETEGGLALDRGSLIHALLHATLGAGAGGRAVLAQRPRPVWMNSVATLQARAQAVLAAAWSGQAAELPGGGRYQPELAWGERFGPELQAQAVHDWAAGILDDWAEWEVDGWPDAQQRRPVLLEANFAFELDGYRLTGRIDRVDEIETPQGPVYEIIDYKTGHTHADQSLKVHLQKFLPEGEQPASDYQLPLYALGLMSGVAGIQGTARALSLLNVEALERKKNGDYKTGACRTVQLAQTGAVDYKTGLVPLASLTGPITQAIGATLAHMAASPYPAQPGNHCSYCSFRSACERAQPEAP